MSEQKTIFCEFMINYFKTIKQDGKKENISEEILNGYKLNRYILDVLTPILRECIKNYLTKKKYDFRKFLEKIISEKTNKSIKYCRDILEKRSIKWKENLDDFDITACSAVVRCSAVFPFFKGPIHSYFNEYENINSCLDNFNEADAFNFARIIRNYYYGHRTEFRVDKAKFDEIKRIILSIITKLNINNKQDLIRNIENTKLIYPEEILREYIKFYEQKVNNEEYSFKFKNLDEIKDGKWIVSTLNKNLNLSYILQCFVNQKMSIKFLSFNAKYIIENKEKILDFLNKFDFNSLCIYVDNNDINDGIIAAIEKLTANLTDLKMIKIIVLIGNFSIPGTNILRQFKELKLQIKMKNLEDQSLEYLFEKSFKFQKSLEFRNLIGLSKDEIRFDNKDLDEILDSFSENDFEKIYIGEIVDLEIKKNEMEFKDDEKENYIERYFKRFVFFDPCILKNTNRSLDDEDKRSKKENVFFYNEEQFEIESMNQSNKEKNIHLIEEIRLDNDEKKKYYIWKKTKGETSQVFSVENRFKQTNQIDEIKEDEMLNLTDKVKIIIDEPGKGKTFILKRFLDKIKNSKESEYGLLIPLCMINNVKKLIDNKNNNVSNKTLEFFLKELLKIESKLQISTLIYLAKNKKITLLLDGFDTVLPRYQNTTIILIKDLIETYENLNVIITSRVHLKSCLQDSFSTLSYDLGDFSKNDQENFFKKTWRNENNNPRVEDLIESYNNIMMVDFMGIPLHCRMLAEIYKEEKTEGKINDDLKEFKQNLSSFFEKFTEEKFKEELKKCDKEQIINDSIIGKFSWTQFLDWHCDLAFKQIFNDNSENLREEDKQTILNYGVITYIDKDRNPTFIHKTFAEFFVARYFIKNIKILKNNKKFKRSHTKILYQKEYCIIRKFINGYLREKKKGNINFMDADVPLPLNKKTEAFEICIKENSCLLMENFLNTFGKEFINNCGKNALLIASIYGHLEIVKILIEQGIDINQKDIYGYNALQFALKYGRLEIVKILIEQGIDLKSEDRYGQNAFLFASHLSRLDIMKILISKGIDLHHQDENGKNALHIASELNDIEIVKFLVKIGIDLNRLDKNGQNALHIASENGHLDLVKILIEKGIKLNRLDFKGKNALHFASQNDHFEIVKILVENGIDLNRLDDNRQNALHIASENGQLDIVKILVEKGIDLNCLDFDGNNALHIASRNGQLDIVKILVKYGIDLNRLDVNTQNALHIASENGQLDFVQILVEKGIDLNCLDFSGNNALHIASLNGQLDIVKILVKKGIDFSHRNNNGDNAFHFASENGQLDIVKILVDLGLDINSRNDNGENPLHIASRYGWLDIVKYLVEKGIALNCQDKNKQNALHIASRYCRLDIMKILVEKGIDLNHKDKNRHWFRKGFF